MVGKKSRYRVGQEFKLGKKVKGGYYRTPPLNWDEFMAGYGFSMVCAYCREKSRIKVCKSCGGHKKIWKCTKDRDFRDF